MYGGFWRRFGAAFIDGCIISLIVQILNFCFNKAMMSIYWFITQQTATSLIVAWYILAYWFIVAIYEVCFQGSVLQATPGQILFDLKVTDEQGARISYIRAFVRWLCKFLSGITLGFGWLMIAFTERKQALHDKIARTLVVRRKIIETNYSAYSASRELGDGFTPK